MTKQKDSIILNAVRVGDVEVSSNDSTATEIAGIVRALLQSEEIKDYLKGYNNSQNKLREYIT